MNKLKSLIKYFTPFEFVLCGVSLAMIIASYLFSDTSNLLSLIASIIGIFGLILTAKGNPIGQGLFIVFAILYAVISFGFAYYGEMITYLCMSLPMAIISLISWLRNPFKENKAEVTVGSISKRDVFLLFFLTALVSVSFYFILRYFETANLLPSTLSVSTSFAAMFLTYKRSPYFALAYALNDIVLIILWGLASIVDNSYLSVIVCFVAFLFNDIYSFVNWQRMKSRQRTQSEIL